MNDALDIAAAENEGMPPPPPRLEARAQYSSFRPDGWPLCPGCGQDELFSRADKPTIETIDGCYVCAWKPTIHS